MRVEFPRIEFFKPEMKTNVTGLVWRAVIMLHATG
jgi:hypothetical protein